MVLRKRTGDKVGFVDFITPQINKRVKEVITRMRESQIEVGLARCGYTNTDYLLAAQAAAEVVTGYARIDGVDLEAELHTPNAERGYHALKLLAGGADVERAVKHLVDSIDFWNIRTTRLAAILSYLRGVTQGNPHWEPYQDLLA